MRAPTRILAISMVAFIGCIVLLSRPASVESVTHTLDARFPQIRQKWLQAKEQARLGNSWSWSYTGGGSNIPGTTNSNGAADASTFELDKGKDKEVKVTNDGSTSKSESLHASDSDREAFRGFTDAEQAEARQRLENTYGQAAKEDLAQDTDVVKAALDGLPQKAATTDPSWTPEPTEVMDREKARAQSILEGMFGAETQTAKNAPVQTEEVGWRTTGVNTAIANRTHTPAAFIVANTAAAAAPEITDAEAELDAPIEVLEALPTTFGTRVHATIPATIPEEAKRPLSDGELVEANAYLDEALEAED